MPFSAKQSLSKAVEKSHSGRKAEPSLNNTDIFGKESSYLSMEYKAIE